MRKLIVTFLFFGLSSLLLSGCEKKTESSAPSQSKEDPVTEDSSDPGKVNIETDPNKKLLESLSVTPVMVPEMLPPIVANAPSALAITITANLTSYDIDCSNINLTCTAGLGAVGQDDCNLAADIKCRFFASSGPTTIKKILGDLDRDMTEIEAISAGKYVPCLDSVGNKDGLEVKDGDQTKTYAPYDEVLFETKHTGLKDKNGADAELDIGYKFSLNCMKFLDEAKTKWTGFGRKKNDAGKNVFTVSTMGGQGGERNGSVGTIDEDDNIVYWGIVSQAGKTTLAELNQSNALIHLKSKADAQTIELNFTGTNVGPGCGIRMITNKTHALIEANLNRVGECESDDSNYDSAKDNVTRCLKVDGEDPEFVIVDDCATAGLTVASFTRERLKSSMILPYEIHKLFQAPQGVPEFVFFELPKKEEPAAQ